MTEGGRKLPKVCDSKEGTILDLVKVVADLKQERDRISRAIAALEGAGMTRTGVRASAATSATAAPKGKRRGGLTAEGRRRLSIAMKKRWAERRKKTS